MFTIFFQTLVLLQTPTVTASDYLMTLAQAVRTAERDARASAQPGLASGH